MSEVAFRFAEHTEPVAVDPQRVPTLSEEELDALQFGVICLDREGKILRYNLAESRLARLDRAQVLGKNFFRRVAPCTATPEFEGRVRAFCSSTHPLERRSARARSRRPSAAAPRPSRAWWRRCVQAGEQPAPRPVVVGLSDERMPVAQYFDAFEWDGPGPDAERLSAEDFLSALET